MTMKLHTQTSAPNPAAATSVSPLEPSGSTKTKLSRGRDKTDIYQTVTDSIIKILECQNNGCVHIKVMNDRVRNNRYFPSPKVFREEIYRFFSEVLPELAGTLSCRIDDNFRTLKNATSG